ncbi:hypothetical protein Hdeb2414_s0289g00858481 [Helianthus debilis subsp. tardiflorus]
MEAHTRVLAKGAEHPNSHSHLHSHARARARGVGDEAQCGALMAHFALESRLCIFDRTRVVKHKGCKDQVVGDAAHDVAVMRMRARVHEARGWAHGAWVLLCRARRTRVSQYGATVWRARIDSQVTWRTPHRRTAHGRT